MGDTFVLDVKIRGDAGSLISEMGKSGAAAKTLNSQLKDVGVGIGAGKATTALGGMRGAMVSTGAAAMAMAEQHGAAMSRVGTAALGAGAALTATAGLAVKAANDWQSAWTGVTKTVDGADLGGVLEGQLRGLAQKLPASHTEIAAVAEAAGQLGVKRQDVASFTKTMIDLGESTNMSADVAATQIARFNNIMGIANSQAKHLGSAIVDLGNSNATTESEIMDMSMRIAAAGRQVRMTAPEILAMSASLTSVGVGAEAGGTSLSKFFVQMNRAVSSGGKDLEVMAKTAGMTSDQFKKMYESKGGAAKAFTEFEKGLGKMIKAGQGANEVMEDLGINEVRLTMALKSMAPNAEMIAKNIDLATKAYEANDKNNALIIEASKRYATAESRMAMAKNRIVDSMIDMGQAIAPLVADTVEMLSKIVSGFTALPAPVKQAVGVFSLFGGGTLLAAGAVGKFLPMLAELRKAMTEIGMISAGESILGGLGGRAGAGIGAALGGLEAKVFARRAAGRAATVAAAKAEAAAFADAIGGGASVATAQLLATRAANDSLAKSTRPVTGALTKMGGALAGVGAAAVPVAGEVALIGAAAVGASVGIAAGATKLADFASGAKKVNESAVDLQAKIASFNGKNFTETFFGDTSKVQSAGVQFLDAVNNINAFNPLNIRTTDQSNAIERIKSLDSTLADSGIVASATTIRSALRSMGGINTETFDRLMQAMPEYSKALDEAAKRSGVSADAATKLKIATGELVEVQNAAGESALQTAMDVEKNTNAYGDLIPTTKEGIEAMLKMIDANAQAAASFIDIGKGADQGLNAWHDAMMKQGKATQEWASNMMQARAAGISDAAIEGLKALGPKGALILQQATDQMRAGSVDGLKRIEEAFGVGGAGAAQTFGEAFSSQAVAAVMQAAYAKGPEVGKAVADAIAGGVTDLNSLVSQYDLQVNVSADTLDAYGKVAEMKAEIEAGTNIMHITATDTEARAALAQLGIDVDATTGTVSIAGNRAMADSTLGELVGNIDKATGTVKINGNTYDAKMTVEEFISFALNNPANVKVKALTNEAEGAINFLTRARTAVINTIVRESSKASGGRGHTVMARGGYITGPGTGTSDSIPAWLSNGEYVMRAAAVRKYGLGFMHRINQNRFAKGGVVGAARFATDPKKWWEEFGKAASNTFEQFAVPSISTVQTTKDVRPELSDKTMNVLYSIEEILKTISGNTQNLHEFNVSKTFSDSYSSTSSSKTYSFDKPTKEKTRDTEKDKQQAEEKALRQYESLMDKTQSYADKITKAFETLQLISKLLEPVAPKANKKGQITDAARQSAAEKQQSNYERAVEKLISLQNTMGGLLTGFAKSWQVQGHERSLLDENGKPTVWDTGGKIDKSSSRDQVMALINFLQAGFKGLFDELGQVKGTMGQKAAPLEIMKQLGWDILGNIQAGKDQKYPGLMAAVAQAVKQAPPDTVTQKLIQPVGEIAEALKTVSNPGVVTQAGGDGKPLIASQLVSNAVKPETATATSTTPDFGVLAKGIQDLQQKATDTFNMLMSSRITVTPEVQIVNIDDIQAHVRVIVKTKLDYADLQTQVNDAVNSITPPPIMVPIQAGASTL